jgi:hypothetical protein
MGERMTAEHVAHEIKVCDAAQLATSAIQLLVDGEVTDETCAETLEALADGLARRISYEIYADRREGFGELAPLVRQFGRWCRENGSPRSGIAASLLAALCDGHALEGVFVSR